MPPLVTEGKFKTLFDMEPLQRLLDDWPALPLRPPTWLLELLALLLLLLHEPDEDIMDADMTKLGSLMSSMLLLLLLLHGVVALRLILMLSL